MSLGFDHRLVCFVPRISRPKLKFSRYDSFLFPRFSENSVFKYANKQKEFRLEAASVSGSGAEYSDDISVEEKIQTGHAEAVREVMGFAGGRLPTNYLGVPLFLGEISRDILSSFVDKITQKVQCWESKLLQKVAEQLLGTKRSQKKQSIAGIDQDELVDPVVLADPDSCFCEFKGVQIHHKICHEEEQTEHSFQNQAPQSLNQTKKIGVPMVLLHGFGASVFSWDRVMKPLARIIGSKVLAFDRPAFGLTSRVSTFEHSNASEDKKPLNPYSMAFSVLTTLYFLDFLAAKKAIIVGHSAGSLVAVDTYFEAPERVAALILIAPAIVAPLTSPKVVKENQDGRENKIEDDSSNSNDRQNPFLKIGNILSKISMYIAQSLMWILKRMVNMVNSLYKKVLTAILRSTFAVVLVRMIIDKFGIAAVRNAWYDANQITDHVLVGYTKPLRTKGWDKALVEFTIAMLTDSASESKPPLTKRLNEISCPVLIITGDSDRLVPSWNAERLSRAIPGSFLHVINNCGHLPHEEKVEEFISVVHKFLQRVFGATTEEQLLHAAS